MPPLAWIIVIALGVALAPFILWLIAIAVGLVVVVSLALAAWDGIRAVPGEIRDVAVGVGRWLRDVLLVLCALVLLCFGWRWLWRFPGERERRRELGRDQ